MTSTTPAQEDLIVSLQERATVAAQAWQAGVEIIDVRPLTGGASSLTYLATAVGGANPADQVVLKVAPPGLAPVRNRDVLRQARVQRALYGQPGVLVPPVFFADAGGPLAVPPFMGMGFVAGECLEPVLADERDPGKRDRYHARGLDAAAVLAAIHRVDPAQVGLSDEPVVTLAEEIERWTTAFGTVAEDLQGDYLRVAAALHASVPEALPPTINHGDYRLGNTLCSGERLAAVIDWEIWSLGDPRVDISWLRFFNDEARHPAAPSLEPTGVPTAEELTAAYLAAGGPALPDLDWFDALTKYKEAAATALLIKRARKAPGAFAQTMVRMAPALPELLRQAEHRLGG
jgi:aminoglycoside phosphotransferase (APT) family kinase protein